MPTSLPPGLPTTPRDACPSPQSPGLSPCGPGGLSGPCDMLLLDAQHLRGELSAFHDGDLALDLRLPHRRRLLCVPLRQLQWLHLDLDAQPGSPAPRPHGPRLEISGPAEAPLRGECLARREVLGGHWLLLRNEQGLLQRWFVHQAPQIRIRQRD